MDAKLQRRVQRYGWDRAAEHYEAAWQRPLAPAQATVLALARLEPGERVLDVACGTGLLTAAAARAVGHAGAVVGVDLSEAMVELARARTAARGLRQATCERMDAEALALPDASFDAALCALGLMYVPDAARAVQEMARVVRPRGRVVAAVWGRRSGCGWADIFPIMDAEVRSDVCPMFFALGTGGRLRDTFAAAGLQDVVEERLETHLEWATEDDACGAAFAGGPVALAYSRFDEPTRERVHREYLRSIAPFRVGEGYAVPGEFVVVAGRKD